MSNLNEYLGQKREAVLRRNARDPQTVEPVKLRAQVSAEGRSGVRRIRIRDHQVVSDSPPISPVTTWAPVRPSCCSGRWAAA